MQKWLWHIRWILLAGLVLYNGSSLIAAPPLTQVLPVNGLIFAFYFILWQVELYVECKSNCSLKK